MRPCCRACCGRCGVRIRPSPPAEIRAETAGTVSPDECPPSPNGPWWCLCRAMPARIVRRRPAARDPAASRSSGLMFASRGGRDSASAACALRAMLPSVSLPASPYCAASGISPMPTLSRTIQMTALEAHLQRGVFAIRKQASNPARLRSICSSVRNVSGSKPSMRLAMRPLLSNRIVRGNIHHLATAAPGRRRNTLSCPTSARSGTARPRSDLHPHSISRNTTSSRGPKRCSQRFVQGMLRAAGHAPGGPEIQDEQLCPCRLASRSFLPSRPVMVNCMGSASAGIRIQRQQLLAARFHHRRGAIVSRQNHIAQTFFRAVQLASTARPAAGDRLDGMASVARGSGMAKASARCSIASCLLAQCAARPRPIRARFPRWDTPRKPDTASRNGVVIFVQ